MANSMKVKDIVHLAPAMGPRAEKALMLYLKEYYFSHPTPISH